MQLPDFTRHAFCEKRQDRQNLRKRTAVQVERSTRMSDLPEGAGIEVTEVVEVCAGYAKKHGLKEGDPVSFEMP